MIMIIVIVVVAYVRITSLQYVDFASAVVFFVAENYIFVNMHRNPCIASQFTITNKPMM